MCYSRSDNRLRGWPYHRETIPLFSLNRSVCVGACILLQKVSFPEFNVVERMKETRQMAYPHHLMTWSSELRHELDTANIITSFLKNLVVVTTNLWNCEVIITFTDLLTCRPFCLNLFPAYFLDLPAKEYAFHSFCVGGILFNLQAGMVVDIIEILADWLSDLIMYAPLIIIIIIMIINFI